MVHPQSAEDAPGIPGLMHDAADILFQLGLGAAVSLVTKNPYLAIGTKFAGPYLADVYESWALTNFGSAETSQSHPLTSTTGHSRRGNGKKQMSSTSSSYSRRRNFYYTKRRNKRYKRY
jgi:hypothetical protein